MQHKMFLKGWAIKRYLINYYWCFLRNTLLCNFDFTVIKLFLVFSKKEKKKKTKKNYFRNGLVIWSKVCIQKKGEKSN